MKKTKLLSKILMAIGGMMILCGLLLFGYNRTVEWVAEKASASTLAAIQKQINCNQTEAEEDNLKPSDVGLEVDGTRYFGVLTIPNLHLELPVQAEWSYKQLRSTPCVYAGSVEHGGLVILAHNYSRHFGRIDRLRQGDEILLTDEIGNQFEYQVEEVLVMDPFDVAEMIDPSYDLSLFTCTYGGKARVTVRCRMLNRADRYPVIESDAGSSFSN